MRRNITGFIYLIGAFIILSSLGLHYVHTDPEFKEMAGISLSHLEWRDLVFVPMVAVSHAMSHASNLYVALLYLIGFSFLSFLVGSAILAVICAPFACLFWRKGAEAFGNEGHLSLGGAWLFLMGYFWFLRGHDEEIS